MPSRKLAMLGNRSKATSAPLGQFGHELKPDLIKVPSDAI